MSERRSGDRVFRVKSKTREFVTFSMWVGVTFVQFSGDELILYPLALYFAIRVIQQRVAILGMVARSWPVLLYPIWCLISPIWAVEPMTAFKLAIYLLLTIMICYHVALNLSPRQIMHAVLIATGSAGVLNFILGLSSGNFAWALFTHKNRMGINMVMLWITSVSTLFDKSSPWSMRNFAALTSALSAFLVFQSDSATAMLLLLASGALIVLSAVLLHGGFWRPSKIAVTCMVLAFFTGVGSIVVSTFDGDPVAIVLDQFGKDQTLTGRTVLWDYAEEQIRERPLLGVGGGGFWRYKVSPLVRAIYEEFYKSPRDAFNFHNSYYEITVHQGFVGLAFVIIAIFWAALWTFRAAFNLGYMPQIFFFCNAAVVLARSFTEAEFLKPFILFHMLFWIGALSALISPDVQKGRRRSNGQQGPIRQ